MNDMDINKIREEHAVSTTKHINPPQCKEADFDYKQSNVKAINITNKKHQQVTNMRGRHATVAS